MASVRKLLVCGLLLTIISIVMFSIGYATSYWIIPKTNFLRMGLWEACFNNWKYHKDYEQKNFNGCWYLLAGNFRQIWKKMSRSWFTGCQVVFSMCLVMELLVLLFYIMYMVGCCPGPRRYKGLFFIGAMQALTAFLILVLCLVFGVKAFQESSWLEKSLLKDGKLGWSFILATLSGVAACLSDIFILMAAVKAYRRSNNEPI